MNENIDE